MLFVIISNPKMAGGVKLTPMVCPKMGFPEKYKFKQLNETKSK